MSLEGCRRAEAALLLSVAGKVAEAELLLVHVMVQLGKHLMQGSQGHFTSTGALFALRDAQQGSVAVDNITLHKRRGGRGRGRGRRPLNSDNYMGNRGATGGTSLADARAQVCTASGSTREARPELVRNPGVRICSA